jgi:hypothetical protein
MDEEYPSWAFEDSDIWRTGSEKTWTNDA